MGFFHKKIKTIIEILERDDSSRGWPSDAAGRIKEHLHSHHRADSDLAQLSQLQQQYKHRMETAQAILEKSIRETQGWPTENAIRTAIYELQHAERLAKSMEKLVRDLKKKVDEEL